MPKQHEWANGRSVKRMTKPWRVDVLECRGSSYDVGKQLAEAFLKTPRGRAYARRKERRPFAFSLRNAEAALKAWAPNIWEELHGLADGLKYPARARGRGIFQRPLALSAARLLGGHERGALWTQLRLRRPPLRPAAGRRAAQGRPCQHRLPRPLHRPRRRHERARALRRPAPGEPGDGAARPRLHPDRAHRARSMRHDSAKPWRCCGGSRTAFPSTIR